MGGAGSDARHLVGGNGHAHSGAAEENASIGLAILDDVGSLDADVRVQGVSTLLDADVDHLVDSPISLEIGLDGVLVLHCRRICGDDDSQSHDPSMLCCRALGSLTRKCEKQRLIVLILTLLM